MNLSSFTSIFCLRPQNFAWFLGAGTSRSAGLPTASDLIWDLKRRYYCREENQEFSRQDIQSDAVKTRIQTYLDAHGFPELWADQEYTTYFEKAFGDDKERQRQYINGILSEHRVTLSVGNRVLGALLASNLSRVVFTTNFDSVVEKAVADVNGQTLSAYHLEGAHAAGKALNNEEYPIYCKLHGDFRYDSIKNLSTDLAHQNKELSDCLVNAANRFGFIVCGYSGRDESVMTLFEKALETPNPFPHGLYWTGLKGSSVHPAVTKLLKSAREKGISAEYIEIETFDSLLLRLWRNIENKPSGMDAKVRRTELSTVNIPMSRHGQRPPLIRFNALPIIATPASCLSVVFNRPIDWTEIKNASRTAEQSLILSKSDAVLFWGKENSLRSVFNVPITSIEVRHVPTDLSKPENLPWKGFLEEALSISLARDRPLLVRSRHGSTFLIVDKHTDDVGSLASLQSVAGKTSGIVPGLSTRPTTNQPQSNQVEWAEALRISIEQKGDNLWLLIDPEIWIWPPRERSEARDFLDKKRGDRMNQKYNALLDAWIKLLFNTDERNAKLAVSAFADGAESENPTFQLGSRTAFAKKLTA
jgi:hypothetical protein